MENMEFRKLYEDELYDSFIKMLSWDIDKKFTDYNEEDFERYSSYAEPYGMYVNGILVGYGMIAKYSREENTRVIAYIINPDYRNKGYGHIFLLNLLTKLKEYPEIKVAILEADDDNYISIHLAIKNGFNKVGEKDHLLVYQRSLKDI